MRDYIEATEGMMLTNGDAYGKKIYPADGEDSNSYYEIAEEGYQATVDGELATDADYQEALRDMGVRL